MDANERDKLVMEAEIAIHRILVKLEDETKHEIEAVDVDTRALGDLGVSIFFAAKSA